MKRITSILAIIMITLTACGKPLDTIKTVDFEISYWNGWKAIKYDPPTKENLDVIIYPNISNPEPSEKNISVRVSHEFSEKMEWGHIREATVDYPKNAIEKYKQYNYKLVSNQYVKKDNALKEEVLEIVFEGSSEGITYTIVQNIYAIDMKVIYVTGFYPKDSKNFEIKVADIMESFKLYPSSK
jgi:hypothetical protein